MHYQHSFDCLLHFMCHLNANSPFSLFSVLDINGLQRYINFHHHIAWNTWKFGFRLWCNGHLFLKYMTYKKELFFIILWIFAVFFQLWFPTGPQFENFITCHTFGSSHIKSGEHMFWSLTGHCDPGNPADIHLVVKIKCLLSHVTVINVQ